MNRTASLLALLTVIGCADESAFSGADYSLVPEAIMASNAPLLSQDLSHGDASRQVRAQAERKLIKTGSISVQVEHYAPFEAELTDWLAQHGGMVTHENVSHSAGEVGWSSLTLRVPAGDLDTLSSWLEETVEVSHLSINTEDVTTTWVDLAARLDNAARTEARLLGLLETDADNLTDVLAVERELSRVRGDIESMEAQKRALDGQIAMSTLSLDVSVQAPYTPAVSASLPDRIGAAFVGSMETMGETGEAALLAGVAASPWLLLLGGGLWGIRTVVRRRRLSA